MALNNLGLGFLFTATDRASPVMGRVRTNMVKTGAVTGAQARGMDKSFVALGAGLGIMATGLVGIGAGFAAANQFGKFEQSLASVGAVTKATEKQMDQLKTAAIQAGIETQFSPDEATQGLLSLATAGQTAEQSTKTLIPVLDLAAGSLGQLGVAESAEAVVGTLNAYGKAADEATGVTDKLLRVTQLTNFQTRDFQTGLSKAAAAGATFGQDLDDVLITMGLLRNRNIDASSSATAFRESVRRLGSDQRAQKAVTEAGVDIFDKQTGKMRSLIDITTDFAGATKDMTDEERNRRVVTAFGARGLLAFNAIQKAAFTQTKDGVTTTLQGAKAIEALRSQMEDASGTAAEFREKLLDTFEGQKTLLKGSLQTLAITGGEAFATTFKPVVSAIIRGVNILIKVIKATPGPVKSLFGVMFIAVSSFTAFAGAGIAVGAMIAILIPAIKIIAIVFGVVLVAMLPVIAAFGALAFAAIGFKIAFEENVGGIVGTTGGIVKKITLAFRTLRELFETGGISKGLQRDLDAANAGGIKQFAINVFLFVNRIKNLFMGIGQGFREGVKQVGPSISRMLAAFQKLGRTLGILGEDEGADRAGKKFDDMGAKGVEIGKTLAQVFEGIVNGITNVTTFIDSAVETFSSLSGVVTPLEGSVSSLGSAFRQIGISLGLIDANSQTTGSNMKLLGQVFSGAFAVGIFIVAANITALAAVFQVLGAVIGAVFAVASGVIGFLFRIIKAVIALLQGDFKGAWGEVKLAVFNMVEGALKALSALGRGVGGIVDSIGKLVGKDVGGAKLFEEFEQFAQKDLEEAFGLERTPGGLTFKVEEPPTGEVIPPRAPPPPATATDAPGVAASSAGAKAGDPSAAIEGVGNTVGNAIRAGLAGQSVQLTSKVELDGEQIAEKVEEIQRGNSGTGFAPGGTSD